MAIVSSVIDFDDRQADGRRWIHELHTDQLGVIYSRLWLALASINASAALAEYAAILSARLPLDEIARNVADVMLNGSLATPELHYSTLSQNFAGLRLAYASALRVDAIMIGDFLNTLSDTQLQNAFGMTAGQVTTLRTNKLVPAANAATTIRASAGA